MLPSYGVKTPDPCTTTPTKTSSTQHYQHYNQHNQLMLPSYSVNTPDPCTTTPTKTSSTQQQEYCLANVSPTTAIQQQYHTNQSPHFFQPTFSTPPTSFGHRQPSPFKHQHLSPTTLVKRRIRFMDQPATSTPINTHHYNRQSDSSVGTAEQQSPSFLSEEFFRRILKKPQMCDAATQTENSSLTPATPQKPPVKRHKRKVATMKTATENREQERKRHKAIRERKRHRNETNAFNILRSNLPPMGVAKESGTAIYAKTHYEIMCTAIEYIHGLKEMLGDDKYVTR